MIKKLQKLRYKKGFTLVELIIVIAILAVLMASVAAFAGPVQNMIRATAVSADALNINEIIGDYIEARLAFANYMTIVYNVNSESSHIKLNDFAKEAAFDNSTKSKLDGGGGNAGVLIFKYVSNTSSPEKSSYQLYDVKLDKNATTYKKPTDDDKVFSDAFYGDTQRVFAIPVVDVGGIKEAGQVGKVRSEVYLSVEIHSFKGDTGYIEWFGTTVDDTKSKYVKSSTLSDYYSNNNTLSDLDVLRVGSTETVTFRANNMKPENVNKTTVRSPIDVYDATDPSFNVPGSDIVIFYYIPDFDVV